MSATEIVGGGGGASYPGVTADGLTPGGLNVAGAVKAGKTLSLNKHELDGQVLIHSQQPDYDDGDDNAVNILQEQTTSLTNGDPGNVLNIARRINNTATGPIMWPMLQVSALHDGVAPAIEAEEVLANFGASGLGGGLTINAIGAIGMFGTTPPIAPRTLSQATINAITDANTKAAVQAFANVLSDMGALTLT